MNGRGRFVVLEGGDGVGKTSLAGRLGDARYEDVAPDIPGWAASRSAGGRVFVSRRQISGVSAYAGKLMDHLATVLWHSGDSADLPDSFWVSLQASWFSAHGSTVVEPLVAAGIDVIVDGWIYKLWSKLLIQGYRLPELETMFGRVLRPDLVVLLDADAEILFDREQRTFRPSELGMHASYTELNRATFVEYQRGGMDNLRDFAGKFGWATMKVGPAESVEGTTERVRSCLGTHDRPPKGGTARTMTDQENPR